MTMSTPPMRPSVRRRAAVVCGLAAGVGGLLVLGAWAAYRHVPSWYRPACVPPEDEQSARDELGAAFSELSKGMGQGRPFAFRVRQDELNRWLVARDRIWPASRRWIPDQIADPMVVFEPGHVILAGTWQGPGPRTVISVRLQPGLEGGKVRVRVLSVRGGALPVPLWPIKQAVARMERAWNRQDEPLLPEGGSMVGAMEGAPLSPEIPWSQPRGKFLIEALDVRSGDLAVQLRPVGRR